MVAESSTQPGPRPQRSSDQPVRVVLLDGEAIELLVDKRSKGGNVFAKVANELNLAERDYFALSFREEDETKVWLQVDKRVDKQLSRNAPWVFFFEVRFYPPEPAELRENYTRYLLMLHVRNDIASGRLPCSFVTQALLGAYLVQATVGDYNPDVHGATPDYVKDYHVGPYPVGPELCSKVAELHAAHRGMSADDAERNYLDKVKCLALYGVEKHPAKDTENRDIWLGVCASGILVFNESLRMHRFPWPKILKVSFRRNIFYINLCPGEFEQPENQVGFRMSSLKAAKRLWKSAVEHHAFFRLMATDLPVEKKSVIPRLGSTNFKFSGRTQFQSRLASSMLERQPPTFQRSMSTRLPTASNYSLAENGVSSVPLSRSAAPIMHKSVDEKPYSHDPHGIRGTIPEVDGRTSAEANFEMDTFPSHMAAYHGAGDALNADQTAHFDPTGVYGQSAGGGGSHSVGDPSAMAMQEGEGAAAGQDPGWSVTTSTIQQREEMGEPETETITETLPDGTIVTRTITKKRVVKQVISKQVIESHGADEYELTTESTNEQRMLLGGGDPSVHETQTRSFLMGGASAAPADVPGGEFVSSQTVSSDGRTVETTTYKTEVGGKTETHTEKRVVIHGEGIDHDAELQAAILEATHVDPNVMVIEVQQQQQRQS